MAESANCMIQAKKLTKVFGLHTAVDGISFTVEKGEILGFLGPNAAGKTTTMKMLTCFYPPTNGTALVNGYDVMENSLEVRRSIGFMPENVPLYTDMTVREYLEFVARAKSMPHLEIEEAIKRTLGYCSLDCVANQLIGTISRGYKQRTGLAQAIINNPPVLILDEPTVGLDPEQIKNFREVIKSLGEKSTIILSTHILSEVNLTCNRVCILDHGRIVADDTPANLEDKVQKTVALRVQVLAPSQSEVGAFFKEIPEVSAVEAMGGEQIAGSKVPVLTFKLEVPKDNLQLRREITARVGTKGWEIYGIQEQRISLEDVYINLVNEHEAEMAAAGNAVEQEGAAADGQESDAGKDADEHAGDAAESAEKPEAEKSADSGKAEEDSKE